MSKCPLCAKGIPVKLGPRDRYVIRHKGSGEYYTVMGWKATATASLIMAVVFPNDVLGAPQGDDWEKVPVEFKPGYPFASLVSPTEEVNA